MFFQRITHGLQTRVTGTALSNTIYHFVTPPVQDKGSFLFFMDPIPRPSPGAEGE